jgi:hypothetical protein
MCGTSYQQSASVAATFGRAPNNAGYILRGVLPPTPTIFSILGEIAFHSSTYIPLLSVQPVCKVSLYYFSKLDVHHPLAEEFNARTLAIRKQGKPTFLED